MSHLPAHRTFDRIVVVHGFGATTHDHWFPWLAETVPGVELVGLSAPGRPDARSWVPAVADAIGGLAPDVAVVAHSLGGITAVRAVELLAARAGAGGTGALGAFVAVAPFAAPLPRTGIPELDGWVADGLDGFLAGAPVGSLRDLLGRVTVITSDDDPLVPAALSDAFAAGTGGDRVVVPRAGHFLAANGITTLAPVVAALAVPDAAGVRS